MFDILRIVAAIAGGFALCSLLALWAYGRFARRMRGPKDHALPRPQAQGPLDHWVLAQTKAHPDKTGLRLIDSNIDAFALRALLAREAVRSLDLMYYIWEEDLTGQLLFEEVMHAAARGVRVRLLLDDVGASGRDRILELLHAHENIAVRLFNPTVARPGSIRRGLEMALRALSMTRRMHNKAWIADGRVAIMGGRNIGDAYFDAAESGTHFRDFDLLAIGPVVDEAEAMFDSYWNSAVALPLRALAGDGDPQSLAATLKMARKSIAARKDPTPYTDYIANQSPLPDYARDRLHWCPSAKLIADPPEKALGRKGDNWMMTTLQPIMLGAKYRLDITSPYFIPGHSGTIQTAKLAKSGVHVRVLTNSLEATDVAAVHGGYARYRKPLLKAGVELYELRARSRAKRLSFRGRSNASLHTKAFTVDAELAFIGSLNFDPRSASLNTEMGVLFECPALIAEMSAHFADETSPELSYRLSLDPRGKLQWHGDDSEGEAPYQREPGASLGRRAFATFVGLLPLESQL